MLLGWLLGGLEARAAELRGLPLVRNIDPGEAFIQGPVWAVARSPLGALVVGSNQLSLYNGRDWQVVDLPGAYAFRGLEVAEDGRIYVGAVGALGYLERAATGEWTFVSLAAALREAHPAPPGDIWQVYALGQGALFVSTDRVMRWNGQTFSTWTMPSALPLQSFAYGSNSVLVYQAGEGLWRWGETGEPQLEVAENNLPARPVTWLSALPSTGEARALVGLGDAAYRWTAEGRFEPVPALSAVLRGQVPSYADWVDSDTLAIGTYKAGVILTTREGVFKGRIDRHEGLADDNISALHADRGGTLWIGHGSGLARVEGVGRSSLFNRELGLATGLPRAVLADREHTAILTSRGLYRLDPVAGKPAAVRLIGEPEAMLRTGAIVAGKWWFGGFGGIWKAETETTGQEYYGVSDVMGITASERWPGQVIFLDGYDLMRLYWGNHGWASASLGQKVHDTPVSLLEGPSGDLWVSLRAGGVLCFTWDEKNSAQPRLELKRHYRPGAGLPRVTGPIRLAWVGSRLFAFTEADILALRPDGRGFEPVAELSDFVGLAAAAGADAAYLLVRARSLSHLGVYALLRGTMGSAGPDPLAWEPVDAVGLDRLGQAVSLDRLVDSAETTLWIGGTQGVLRLLEPLRGVTAPEAAALQGVRADGRLQALGGAEPPGAAWPADTSSVLFQYASGESLLDRPIFYQTRLSGVETAWSEPGRATQREFTGLKPGRYTFAVRTIDRFGRTSPPATYAFSVALPWYLQHWAYLAYALLGIAVGGGAVRWRSRHLRRQNERLNRLMEERTRELELSHTARAEFLENISHEIRNPLNGLNGLLSLLKEAPLGQRERELTDSLRDCARDLTRTFEEVLGFSKLEYGYVVKEEHAFLLRGLLKGIVDSFAWQARQQGNTLQLHWPDDVSDGFRGDSGKIQIILSNFLGNAIKYAPGTPIDIVVEVQAERPDIVDVCLEVSDQGPGIAPEEQALIFQKFVRGSQAKETAVPGTGLGLATCRVMAKVLGGNVGVESSPGRGATFYLRVPLRPAPSEPSAPPVATEAVLIVEDELYNQRVLQGIATALGYEAVSASNAEQALVLAAERTFAIVFLDWELPGLKGGEVARQIRRQKGGEQPVILATTAHDSEKMRRQCQEAGMDEFILKPYDTEVIRQRIQRVRQRRLQGRAAPPEEGRAPAESDSLNLRAFSHFAAGTPDQAHQAVAAYLEALAQELAALETAVAQGANETIFQRAHRVRSLGGLLAAAELTQAAQRLEVCARQGSREQQQRAWEALSAASGRLRHRLESIQMGGAARE